MTSGNGAYNPTNSRCAQPLIYSSANHTKSNGEQSPPQVKGVHCMGAENLWCISPPPSPEDHHETINPLHTIAQVIQNQGYEVDGMVHSNSVRISSKSAMMAQLAQLTIDMVKMQSQIKTLSSSSTTISKRKCYFCIYGSNFSHGNKTCTTKKSGHKDEAYCKKYYGADKRGANDG